MRFFLVGIFWPQGTNPKVRGREPGQYFCDKAGLGNQFEPHPLRGPSIFVAQKKHVFNQKSKLNNLG